MKKFLTIAFIISLLIVTGVFLYLKFLNSENISNSEQDIAKDLNIVDPEFSVKSTLKSQEILMTSLTKISPDNKYIVFVTVEDYGFTNSKLWIVNFDGSQKRLLDKQDSTDKEKLYSFFSAITWKEDSSLFAYLKVWPTEIYAVNPATLQKELLITKFDGKDNNILNPSISKEGKSYLEWSGDSIIFENNQSIPESKYSLNFNTKEVTKIFQAKYKDLNTTNKSFFSQRDLMWKDLMLGGCEKQTIGTAGCAISSISMALKGLDIEFSPEDLNKSLSENNFQGYVNGCDVKWYSIPNFVQGVTFKGSYDSNSGFERIDYELSLGNQIIMGFKKVPYTNLQHWVLIKEKRGNEYILTDPWETDLKEKTLKDFGGKFDYLVVYSNN